jgi:hypothetical protein
MQSRFHLVVCFGLVLAATSAQTGAPRTRPELIKSIDERAQEDAANGAPREDLAIQLYHNNKFGVTDLEISQTYRRKYSDAREAKKHWWERIPSWLALLVAVFAVFGRALLKWLEEQIKKVYEALFTRYAGAKIFRRQALKRYRAALVRQHQRLKIPFRDAPLEMREVYVPLKFADRHASAPVDAQEAIRTYPKLMVIGSPGSGKSMLLKSTLLAYGDGRLTGTNGTVAVLIELSRLNDPNTSLEQQIQASFDRSGFPNAGPFVTRALERNQLLLLLDGLDEVNATERSRVVRSITDLAAKYDCRAVITCRTQVYRDEFATSVDRAMKVDEFSDHDILRFLKAWEPAMNEHQSVDHLMQTIHERPRIQLLARNPLLLTMIAYLYADAQITLPHSRAEFYENSTSLLLEKWQGAFNRFKRPAKASVLSQLALRFQEQPAADQDRRSLGQKEVLEIIRDTLPGVDVRSESAGDLLDEIVDRSGLMLRIGSGAEFQFTHLTMQEYFAATALTNSREVLLEQFKRDRDTWREVVKLWCGIVPDCSAMVVDVVAVEEITALECLADARFVRPEVAAEIVDRLRPRLGESGDAAVQDPLAKAFGLLAASPGPRGTETLEWLNSQLSSDQTIERRAAAAKALAYSHRGEAAIYLAAASGPEAQAALESMGDTAVRPLLAGGHVRALARIGTPRALEAIVSQLWSREARPGGWAEAAWVLAAAIANPEVEAILQDVSLPPTLAGAPSIAWVWEPFGGDHTSLAHIAGRVAWLLAASDWRLEIIDPRLAIPLFIHTRNDNFLSNLPTHLQPQLLERIEKLRAPVRDDWLRIFQPLAYEFQKTRLFRAVVALWAAVTVCGMACMLLTRFAVGWAGWPLDIALIFALVWETSLILLLSQWTGANEVAPFIFSGFPNLRRLPPGQSRLAHLLFVSWWTPLNIYYCSVQLHRFWPMPVIIALWFAVYLFFGLAYMVGYRKEKRARNPLHGLLDPPATGSLEFPHLTFAEFLAARWLGEKRFTSRYKTSKIFGSKYHPP